MRKFTRQKKAANGERREVARCGQQHKGMSIILMPSRMAEIIKLAVRILVFFGNRIVGEFDNSRKD